SPIDAQKVNAAFATLARELREPGAHPCPLEMLAESFLEVGVEAMANAIRQVATRQGRDAGEFTLFCFGGAAGQHACRVARAAGVRRILVHPLASVLSAFGIGVADRLAVRRASLRRPLDEAARAAARTAPAAGAGELPQRVRAWFGGWREVPLVPMGALRAELEGPALIVEAHSTVVLEEGWRARRLPGGELLLEESGALRRLRVAAAADPARIEIFNNLFMHIAEQMGEVLKSTAQSVNIRERLDYPCALFDADGGLVANAPHMPVHLGSMGASVRAVIAARRGRLEPGDSWLLNSPYHGGTHLPDMTVVTPVFVGARASPRFFVASRAHHADIGGMTPGSMPPFSRTIEEEGAL